MTETQAEAVAESPQSVTIDRIYKVGEARRQGASESPNGHTFHHTPDEQDKDKAKTTTG